jgi:AraC-like DNA-binding protein
MEYPKVYLYRRIVQAKLFIDANYMHPIDLDNISEEASFSKFHFIRLFKQAYGKTPHQYLVHIRIEKAKELLRNNIAVTDACFSVGFESPGSFSTLFKKMTGLSPSAYLIRQQERKNTMQRAPLLFIPGCFSLQD